VLDEWVKAASPLDLAAGFALRGEREREER
jgi:hypothetical protein